MAILISIHVFPRKYNLKKPISEMVRKREDEGSPNKLSGPNSLKRDKTFFFFLHILVIFYYASNCLQHKLQPD